MKPETTIPLSRDAFIEIGTELIGVRMTEHLLNLATKTWTAAHAKRIAGIMASLNIVAVDHETDSTRSIGAYEHSGYHAFMGQLLRMWKKAAVQG